MSRKDLTYEQYLASDVWRCKDSPTTAHHWKEIQGEHTGLWYCKYCKDVKTFPSGWGSITKLTAKEG